MASSKIATVVVQQPRTGSLQEKGQPSSLEGANAVPPQPSMAIADDEPPKVKVKKDALEVKLDKYEESGLGGFCSNFCGCCEEHSDPTTEEKNDAENALREVFNHLHGIMLKQQFEKLETASLLTSLGCCKWETDNRYLIVNSSNGQFILAAMENSSWMCRNPCICCDCVCWCLHSDCNKRRNFIMPVLSLNSEDHRQHQSLEPVFVIKRPCRSDCFPCCLQKIEVCDRAGLTIGSIHQKMRFRMMLPFCDTFEVLDENGEVVYQISAPCVVTTFCCTEADFVIRDMKDNVVGEITKLYDTSDAGVKESFTDIDMFTINYPHGCSFKMKAVLLAAIILFDYIYYES